MNIERLSLDQMRVFDVVSRVGTFSGAGKELGRAQSAVSYAISELENQLGLRLFERPGQRPSLTREGELLLREVRAVLERVDQLHAKSLAISMGLESVVTLSVDPVFPFHALGGVLAEFAELFPGVAVRVSVDTLSGPAERVLSGECMIGVLCTFPEVPAGLTSFNMPPVLLLPVVASVSPLAKTNRGVSESELRDHRQIVLSDTGSMTLGKDYDIPSTLVWRVSDVFLKRSLIKDGLGWGFLPQHIIEGELKAGDLCEIVLTSHPLGGDIMRVNGIVRTGAPLGPAAQWMMDALCGLKDYTSQNLGRAHQPV